MSPGPIPEQVRDFLTRRERELSQQISALRGQIVPKEQELAEVHKAMMALGMYSAPLKAFVSEDALAGQLAALNSNSPAAQLAPLPPANSLHTKLGGLSFGDMPPPPPMTIKQMIDSALRDHFRDGATPAELRDYFKTAYGRDVSRSSISPQLARLQDAHRIEPTESGKWTLTRAGLLFDHPTSWNPADEPPGGAE